MLKKVTESLKLWCEWEKKVNFKVQLPRTLAAHTIQAILKCLRLVWSQKELLPQSN